MASKDLRQQKRAKGIAQNKKEKKKKIEISLWINKTKYEYGILCTFCAKLPAVCHCSECPDFYCPSCDISAHATKKRQGHIRNLLSKLTLDAAAKRVTFAVRYHAKLRSLQKRCRKLFKRRFDRKTLCYYYFNTVYRTSSWRKPYCLRKEELCPYFSRSYAASKVQNLYYIWKAHAKTREQLKKQYVKIFDRKYKEFYYGYNGKSKLIPRQSWRKPRILGKRGLLRDIMPIFTIDVAAVTIQRKWRAILILKYLKALARASYDELWDPVTGSFTYYHRDSEVLFKYKPKLLRNEPWDPNRIPDWTVERVTLFLRRIGLKRFVDIFKAYGVDGKALLLLDPEDFENMKIFNKVLMKKVTVEVSKLYKRDGTEVRGDDHARKRDKIRRQKLFHSAASMIQKQFRIYRSRREYLLQKDIKRVKVAKEMMEQKVLQSNIWWTESDFIPSKHLNDSFDTKPESVSVGLKLPAIKNFGRQRSHTSYRGWGRKGNGLNSSFEVSESEHDEETLMLFNNPSIRFAERLQHSGYDQRRLEVFLKSKR